MTTSTPGSVTGARGSTRITGGLTTAVAFLALNISSLELLKELGTVMGLGIICTLLSVFWVLPALIVIKKEKDVKIQKIRGEYKWVGKIATGVKKARVIVIILLVVSTGFMAYKATEIEFDLNLMNLEPEGLESIEMINYLVEKYDMSSDSFSIEVDNLEDVYRLHDAYSKVDGVNEVTSIASFIPREEEQQIKLDHIEALKSTIPKDIPLRELDSQALLGITMYNQESLKTYKELFMNLLDKNSKLIELEDSFEELEKNLFRDLEIEPIRNYNQ